jgi:hypothetical protein
MRGNGRQGMLAGEKCTSAVEQACCINDASQSYTITDLSAVYRNVRVAAAKDVVTMVSTER